MSWDVDFSNEDKNLGKKEHAREALLSGCEAFLGKEIPRRGPTEVDVDPSFRYEVLFLGEKWKVTAICLSFQILEGDPHQDPQHPVWKFIKKLVSHNSWLAIDSFSGNEIR